MVKDLEPQAEKPCDVVALKFELEGLTSRV